MAVRKVTNMKVGTKEGAVSVINLTIDFFGSGGQFTGRRQKSLELSRDFDGSWRTMNSRSRAHEDSERSKDSSTGNWIKSR